MDVQINRHRETPVQAINTATIFAIAFTMAFAVPATAQHAVNENAPVTMADVGEKETWGGASNVVRIKHLYFSEQPDAATFAEAAKHDVQVVIDLREPGETDWDEEAAAKEAGLQYYNVPVAGSGESLDEAAMQKISALAEQHRDNGILLHCSSGNRASAWLAVHLVKDHGMAVEPSIAIARKAGLDKPPVEARVRTYLGVSEN
jgi:uncharacterized protein (TIGR01244 family)